MQQSGQPSGGFAPSRSQRIEEALGLFDWFATMRVHQPVHFDASMRMWQIFRYQDVQRVVTDYGTYSSERVPGFSENTFLRDTIVSKDPPDHRKLRNLVNQAFTPRAINKLETRIEKITQDILDQHLEQGKIDIASDIAFPLPARVIAEMLGVPDSDWDIFRRWMGGEGNRAEAATINYDEVQRAQQSMGRFMYDYFSGLLTERRRSPREDLISMLSVAEVDGERLSEHELVSFCLLLLAAGQETTKNLLANAIYCFSEHPDILQRLVQEPALMPSAIEEVLRFLPPVWFTLRRALKDSEIAGQIIPANSVVHAWNASANHDRQQFTNPDQFDIQREPNRHMSFGHGIHFCIGAPLARLEARVALPMMLSQLKNLQRVSAAPVHVNVGIVFVIHSLPMTFDPR